LGERIGRSVRAGTVIAFRGGLGAGKTTLTKGIACGLGVKDEVTSPTYTLVFEYQGRIPLRHVDAYRLSNATDFDDIGGRDLMARDGLCVIEWSERIEEALPTDAVVIDIKEGPDTQSRVFEIRGEALEEALS
jgi:tRNA threonylcarbamoyladenosine biosynthesis protein TsaE